MNFDPKQSFEKLSFEDFQNVLYQVWMEGDIDSFKAIIASFLSVHNKQGIAKKMGVSRNTLYQMVSPGGNPSLDTVFKLIKVLKKAA